MKYFPCLLFALLLLAGPGGSSVFAQAATDALTVASPDSLPPMAPGDALPADPAVRTGTLDNGVRYYVRYNDEPEDRAELRLAVDAGALLEDDDQRGLAHFVEHMLFNGTRRFEEQALVDFLERTGMRFGPDVNAYTSFDETVYTLTIPTDSTDIVEKAFDVLEDWAGYATLSEAEIEKERPVVIEEWRARLQNASGRLMEKILPVLLHESRYQDRLPIGDTTVIRHADPETIRRFYEEWYRPDLMAVVAVGDFDVERVEELIVEHFGALPILEGAAPRPRPTFDVPGHEETLYAVATDPEQMSSSVEVTFKREAETMRTVADYREALIGQLFRRMLNDRFTEIVRRADAPFLGARVYRGSFVRPSEFYGLEARVADDSVLVGLAALLTEATRVRTHGFTETELARQKRDLLRGYQQAYDERANTHSAGYADEYVSHFLEDEPFPGIAYEYALAQRYLPEIGVEEVNALADELLAEKNRAVLVTMPEKDGLAPPTEADLATVFDRIAAQPVSAYVDDVSDAPLLGEVPAPAAIVAETTIPELEVTEITLANGVRVVMKPTDFKEDEVRFSAFSPGGTSLVPVEDLFEAEVATALVAQSGLGPFERTQLDKLLAGKVVSVGPYVSELEEGLGGSASPEDLETLFQLIHLYFTAPRADSTAFEALKNQQRSFLVNRAANPMAAFQDTLMAALFGDHPRRRTATLAMVDTLDRAEAFARYRERFADAGDFTFLFVGNFDVARLKTLARVYLGTLPDLPGEEMWRDVAPDFPAGVIEKTARKGLAQQSQAAILFNGPFAFDRENRHAIRSLAEVLSIRLREELREERGGVYNVAVQPGTSDRPDSTYQFVVAFGTDPARVEELVAAVFDEIEKLKADGPSAEVMEKVKEQQRRERETQLKTNGFWLSVLDFYYSHDGEDPRDALTYGDMIESLTAEDVRQAARRYLNRDRYVKVVLLPEN